MADGLWFMGERDEGTSSKGRGESKIGRGRGKDREM